MSKIRPNGTSRRSVSRRPAPTSMAMARPMWFALPLLLAVSVLLLTGCAVVAGAMQGIPVLAALVVLLIAGCSSSGGGGGGGAKNAGEISIADASAPESDGELSFTIKRADGSGTSTVDWATSDGKATAGDDYVADSGTVEFGSGDDEKTITIVLEKDSTFELGESFTVTLSNPGGATLGTATAEGRILNDEDLDLSGFGSAAFSIRGAVAGDESGKSVASAGDVNGDGFDDVIVGAWVFDAGGTNHGAAYVIFGKASGFGTVDLADLGSSDGFAILGAADNDYAGVSVASAGDMNGDGYDDVIVGARSAERGPAHPRTSRYQLCDLRQGSSYGRGLVGS